MYIFLLLFGWFAVSIFSYVHSTEHTQTCSTNFFSAMLFIVYCICAPGDDILVIMKESDFVLIKRIFIYYIAIFVQFYTQAQAHSIQWLN